MQLFNVYKLLDISPEKGKGSYVYDKNGQAYLDFYGGHAVISIGHSHPAYVKGISEQVSKLGFYSNSVHNPIQQELADKLETASNLSDFELFLCNSGAEANENALKMSSFRKPGTNKILTLKKCFHGRTSAAVNITDNPSIQASINKHIHVMSFELNDIEDMVGEIKKGGVTAVMIEAIQGVGGLDHISVDDLKKISHVCKETGTTLIMDEVQCGYGRSGKFFAFQHADITPDIVTIAKGMGNGFPIAGVLLNSTVFNAKYGLLGTTFGGNHLACAAGIAVLDVLETEDIINQISEKSNQIKSLLSKLPGIKCIKGKGLMLGAEFDFAVKPLREKLVYEHHLITGTSANPNLLRLLPPLNISSSEIDEFGEKIHAGLHAFINA